MRLATGAATKPSVTEAKEQLRGWGQHGCALASRLGKASKLRNGWAHGQAYPDKELAKDILKEAPGCQARGWGQPAEG